MKNIPSKIWVGMSLMAMMAGCKENPIEKAIEGKTRKEVPEEFWISM